MSQTTTPRRLTIEPLDDWGKLVKSWATRQDYVGLPFGKHPPRDYSTTGQPVPSALTETTLDADANGAPKPWALPPMSAVPIPSADDGVVMLGGAIALTVEQFRSRLIAANIDPAKVNIPSQYSHVIIVQGNAGTMVLRLPPRDVLQAAEDDLLNAKAYEIPDFYVKYYAPTTSTGQVAFTPPTQHVDIMELHAYRIGEYTLNSCN